MKNVFGDAWLVVMLGVHLNLKNAFKGNMIGMLG